MREIKFRLFYTAQNGDKSIIYDNDRYLVGLNGTVYENYGKSWKEPLWQTVFDAECPPTISRFTGLKDKNGKEIYEGDIVSFNYTVGDFAWEAMDDDERDVNKEMMGKPYICRVVWCEMNCGFMMVDGSVESSHIQFPMLYAKTGEVIGNIFENPILLPE